MRMMISIRALRRPRACAVAALWLCAAFAGYARGQSAPTDAPPRPIPDSARSAIGLTAPRRNAAMGAVLRGRIARVPVREGQMVAAGDELFALDDAVQRSITELAAARAASTLDADLARTKWDRDAADLRRLESLGGEDLASAKEIFEARAAAEAGRINHGLALLQQELNRREHVRQSLLLAQHRVLAPFDGYVAEIGRQPGEVAEESDVVVRLVELHPLLVTVDCPIEWAAWLRAGDTATLTPATVHFPPRTGTICLASRAGDAASQTCKVKIEVDNRDHGWVVGLKVRVDFAGPPPTDGVAADAGRAGGMPGLPQAPAHGPAPALGG